MDTPKRCDPITAPDRERAEPDKQPRLSITDPDLDQAERFLKQLDPNAEQFTFDILIQSEEHRGLVKLQERFKGDSLSPGSRQYRRTMELQARSTSKERTTGGAR